MHLHPAGMDSGQRRVSIRVVTKAWKGIAVTRTRQILFIQGGGAGAHDEWDDKRASCTEDVSRPMHGWG